MLTAEGPDEGLPPGGYTSSGHGSRKKRCKLWLGDAFVSVPYSLATDRVSSVLCIVAACFCGVSAILAMAAEAAPPPWLLGQCGIGKCGIGKCGIEKWGAKLLYVARGVWSTNVVSRCLIGTYGGRDFRAVSGSGAGNNKQH